ncbi:hypothetical protein ABPG74_003343 [Tetrahymena malaccensis]
MIANNQQYKFIQMIDIYGNNYYQFRDTQSNQYKIYSETIPDELRFLGNPIKNQIFIHRMKILAANNIKLLLEAQEYELKHDCCQVRRDDFWFKQPLIPKSVIKFNREEQYNKHMQMIERISNITKQDFKSYKQHYLKIYSQNQQNREVTVECVSQNLLDVIKNVINVKGQSLAQNDFVRNFTYLLEEMYKKMLKKIDLLVNRFQIYQADISFQNIILTTEGKWEFLSYANAIQIDNRKKTQYIPNKRDFIFERYQNGGNYTQLQFFDSSLKSLALVIMQAIQLVKGQQTLVSENSKTVFQCLNEIKQIPMIVQNELSSLLSKIFEREFSRRDYNISLFKIDKAQVLQTYQLLDKQIKEYKSFYKFFTDSTKQDAKIDNVNNKPSSDDQLLMFNQLRYLDSTIQSGIHNKFIINVSIYNESINTIKQTLLNQSMEIARMYPNQDPTAIVENFIKRIKTNNLPQTSIHQMLPEISDTQPKQPYKQVNSKDEEVSNIIDIQERDYLIACAILKHNTNILYASLKISDENFKKQDFSIFESIVKAFAENKIIQHFVCSFEGVQFNQKQFDQLKNALVNNKYCQIYELNFDKTNLQTNQIIDLKQLLNNRKLTQSLFISYKESNFKKENNDQFNIIRENEPNTGSFQELANQQNSQIGLNINEDEIYEPKSNESNLNYPFNKPQIYNNNEVTVTTQETLSRQQSSQIQSQLIHNFIYNDNNHNINDTIPKSKTKQVINNTQQQNQNLKSNTDNKSEKDATKAKTQDSQQESNNPVNKDKNQSICLDSNSSNNKDFSSGLGQFQISHGVQEAVSSSSTKNENSEIFRKSQQNEDQELSNIQEENKDNEDKKSGEYQQSNIRNHDENLNSSNQQSNQIQDQQNESRKMDSKPESNGNNEKLNVGKQDNSNIKNINQSSEQQNLTDGSKMDIKIQSQKQHNGDDISFTQENQQSQPQKVLIDNYVNEIVLQNQKKIENVSGQEGNILNTQQTSENQNQGNQPKSIDQTLNDGQQNNKINQINVEKTQAPSNDFNQESINQNQLYDQASIGNYDQSSITNDNNDTKDLLKPDKLESQTINEEKNKNSKFLSAVKSEENESSSASQLPKSNRDNVQQEEQKIIIIAEKTQTPSNNINEDSIKQNQLYEQSSIGYYDQSSIKDGNDDTKDLLLKADKLESQTTNEKKNQNTQFLTEIKSQENESNSSSQLSKQNNEDVQQEEQMINQIIVEKNQVTSNNINQEQIKQNQLYDQREETSVGQYYQNNSIHEDGDNKDFQKNDLQQLKEDVTVTQDSLSQSQSIQLTNQLHLEAKRIMNEQQQDLHVTQAIKEEKIKNPNLLSNIESQENESSSVSQPINNVDGQQENPISQIIIEKSLTTSNNITQEEIKQNQVYEIKEEASVGNYNLNNIINQDDNQKDFQKFDIQYLKEDVSVTQESVSISQSIQLKNQVNQEVSRNLGLQQDSSSYYKFDQQQIEKKDIQKDKIEAIKEEVSVTIEVDSPRESSKSTQQQLQDSQKHETSLNNFEHHQNQEFSSQLSSQANFQQINNQEFSLQHTGQIGTSMQQQHVDSPSLQHNQFEQQSLTQQDALNQNDYQPAPSIKYIVNDQESGNQFSGQNQSGFNFHDDFLQQVNNHSNIQEITKEEQKQYDDDDDGNENYSN